MQVQTIINQPGPLPIKVSFKSPLDGPALLVVTGSVWSNAANANLTVNVLLDNNQIGTAQIWSNGTGTHRAFPTLFLGFKLTYGEHVLTLKAGNGNVITDLNDPFNASLIF